MLLSTLNNRITELHYSFVQGAQEHFFTKRILINISKVVITTKKFFLAINVAKTVIPWQL
jgi:hypothetical protein